MGAVDAMVVMKQTQTQKSPTGSPCRLLIDGPANGFLDVQRADLQYATGGDVQTLSRRGCGCRQAGRQVEASSGACEKTKDLRSCRFTSEPVRYHRMVDASGAILLLLTGARARCQRQRGHECCTNLQPTTAPTLRPSPKIRESFTPISCDPNVASSQLAMSAAWLASVESTLSRPLWLWVRPLAKPLETGLSIRGRLV